jgi:hypothetical protein
VTLGPPTATTSGLHRAKVLLTHPKGFQLAVASSTDPSRLGSGPILDIAFDRTSQVIGCESSLDAYFSVRSLEVRDTDGTLRVSRPYPSETGFDASSFFHFHYVDPDGAS